MAKIQLSKFLKKQLAMIVIDIMDGEIDDQAATARMLREMADVIERG